jgi:hypothetical protein
MGPRRREIFRRGSRLTPTRHVLMQEYDSMCVSSSFQRLEAGYWRLEQALSHKWAALYFTPFPIPSCPAYEPNSNDGEYSQPFRHIQYNRTASLRPIATLAILLCRRIAR